MTEMTDVAIRVAEVMQVPVREILGRSRHNSIINARKILYCTLRMMGKSTTEIEEFCGKAHSTIAKVTHSVKPEITDIAMHVLMSLNLPAYEMKTAFYKAKRKRYVPSKPKKFRKVPDYKNNCIRWVEVK